MEMDMGSQDKKKEVGISQYYDYESTEGFWNCVKNTVKIIFSQLLYWVLIVYYAFKSTTLSKRDKVKILAALAYLILQSDLIPDAIPVVGIIDDAAILWAIFKLLVVIDEEVKRKAREKVRQWFG